MMDAPYQPHSATSREAASAIRPKAETLRMKIHQVIRETGAMGMTDEEVQTMLGIDGSTQRPRRVELQRRDQVRDSGRTRATASGRQATVWVAT